MMSEYDGPGAHRIRGRRFALTRANLGEIADRVPPTVADIERAIMLAIECHAGQRDRPDGTPYLDHVTRVAVRVGRWTRWEDADVVVAGLLHDSVEDQPKILASRDGGDIGNASDFELRDLAVDSLAAWFGPRVAEIVRRLSNPLDNPLPDVTIPVEAMTAVGDACRLNSYWHHFVEVLAASDESSLVKLADFADNALRLDAVRRDTPGSYPWLVRKYGPCVAFLRELLPGLVGQRQWHRAWRDLQGEIDMAWIRDFAPRA